MSAESQKVHVQTFGCQMNEYDTDKMLEVLREENYTYTESPEEADLILLNTCSVREKAEQKVYSLLGAYKKKLKHKDVKIGVGGCVAQQEGKAILQRSQNVDFVFGTDNLFELPDMLEEVKQGNRVVQTERKDVKQKVRNFIPDFTFQNAANPGIKAHLAITKGCDKFCTFCIVPTTRGREVSREPENIIEEAKRLVGNGTKEICLLGQNVNSYRTRGINFVDLLYQLNDIEGLERIRFTSPHPRDFKEPLARAFKELDSLCEQMHLPLQSGSDRILKNMKRYYSTETYLEKVAMLREYVPQVTISTDMIVGFPGETDEDFWQTIEMVKKVQYDHMYSFKYSPRPGTPASFYDEQLSEDVKIERLRILQETHDAIQQHKQQALVGSTQEVLVEGEHPRTPNSRAGRTRGHHSVIVHGSQAEVGSLIDVKVTATRKYSLEAEEL